MKPVAKRKRDLAAPLACRAKFLRLFPDGFNDLEVAERAIAIEGRTNLLFSFEKWRSATRSGRYGACGRWGFVYGAGDAFNPWRGVRQAASTDRYSLDQRSVCQYFKYVHKLAIKVRKQSLGKIQCLD